MRVIIVRRPDGVNRAGHLEEIEAMADETKQRDMDEALADARSLLEYAASLGFTEVEVKPPLTTRTNPGERSVSRAQTPSPTTAIPDGEKAAALEALRREIGDCTRCKLCKGRTKLVFGVGNPNADLMFVGEGPGRDEDLQGIPFVGRAGQLLTKIIEAMGLKRDDVYIANVVKCRPPNNRNPEPDEVAMCKPFLVRQVEIIKPRVIVCLGSVATQNLLATEEKITRMRGRFTEWQGIPVMPTYHPAFLLRNPDMKKPVWEDMQKVMKQLSEGS
jgi:DNA polymerase